MNPKLFIPLFLSLFFANYCFSQTYRGAEASQIINNTDLVKFKEYTSQPQALHSLLKMAVNTV